MTATPRLLLALAAILSGSAFAASEIKCGDCIVQLSVVGAENVAVSSPQIALWVKTSADAVALLHGRFPVDRARLTLSCYGRGCITGGVTRAGRSIRMTLGNALSAEDFKDDWMLVHEMLHLGFPDLDEKHLWMEEGMATYFEPIARARAGNMSQEQYWKELVEGLPRGLPRRGDRGLDMTPTHDRTYWGGALYWFLADLQIREKTANKHSAVDVLRAVREAGGDGTQHWEIARVIKTGDAATGTSALNDLYAVHATAAVPTDLSAIWKSLGVSVKGRVVTFDDTAPLADIRKAMTK